MANNIKNNNVTIKITKIIKLWWGVELVARKPDTSRVDHTHLHFSKGKKITICHVTSHDAIGFDTHGMWEQSWETGEKDAAWQMIT